MTILTSEDKEKIKRAIPKASNKIIDATAARLYIAYPDTNAWKFTGLSGAIVFSDDLVGHTFFLKMVDIHGNRGVLWDQELYVDFQYNQDRLFFHTFELDECLAGLLFEDKKDAQHFYKRVAHREKYGSKQTLHNKKAIELKKKPSADTNERKIGLRGDLSQSTAANDGISNEQRIRRAHGVIYYDKEPPPEWRSFYKELESVGIKESMIAENREFIKDYISKHGGPLVGLEPPIPRKYMYKTVESDVASRKSSVSSSTRRKKAPPPPPPAAGGISSSSVSSLAKNPESAASSQHSASPDPFAAPSSAATTSPQKHFVPPLPASVHQQQQLQQQTPQPFARPLPPQPGLPPRNGTVPTLPVRATANAPPPPPPRNSNPTSQILPQNASRRSAAPPPPPPRRTGPPPPPSRNTTHKILTPPPSQRQSATQQPTFAATSPPRTTFPAAQPTQQTQYGYSRPAVQAPVASPQSASISTSPPPPPAFPASSVAANSLSSAIPAAPPAPLAPPLPPTGQQGGNSAIPAAPPAPPAPTTPSAPPAPPAPTTSSSNSAPALPQVDSGREALLASIRGAGIQSLRKTDKTHLDRPSPLLQKKSGASEQVSSPGATPGQPGNLADALAVALKARKDKVSQSDDEDDDW